MPTLGADLEASLRNALSRSCATRVVDDLVSAHSAHLAHHGDFAGWMVHLAALPVVRPRWHIDDGCVVAGQATVEPELLSESLHAFIPWRKGPLCLGGLAIDTEWRSDWKWNRIAPHIDLSACRVLDVGAGNGYFGWRMLADGAAEVIGCDPTPLFVLQHAVIRHFSGPAANHLLARRLEDLPGTLADFDAVFSMGVLYHRRDPGRHLVDLRRRLKPGGVLVLETLIAPGEIADLLPTPQRYAGMRNVHGLPTQPLLCRWLEQSGFEAVRCVDLTPTTVREQRSTRWMPFHSLAQALDPVRTGLTIEGLPAPVRAVWLARRPSQTARAC
ncbi:MAG: tRNA 5-methoxyuridine(34)/uridine 5-oxyacetic acid(34) synthase CmoB [Wenzhouxiangella sp.]|nr:tRNA 5-methoxyuridine(34)/uridine 5-oxyacetic acid(34) synthase CmoB [Wenzhouxiangella sp.]